MKVAYILDYFPVLSQTFIVREILEMRKKHLKISIYACQDTSNHIYNEITHSDTKELMKDVHYFSSLMKAVKIERWGRLVIDHLLFFMRKPVNYLKIFYFSLSKGRIIFFKFIFSVSYAKELQKAGIDHMHVHFALHACTYSMLISMISGIPFSFTVHAHDIFMVDLAGLLLNKFNNAKFSVCISRFNKEFVINQFPSISQGKINVIHCGLDLSVFAPRKPISNKKFTILAVGRLVEHKGFRYLVMACKQLMEENGFDFTCNIIGEGKERQDLEKLISEHNLADVVHLLGSVEQIGVVKMLNNTDVFVLPCITEGGGMQDGIPVSLMEAMAIEIPVISTIVSGVPELVHDNAGILVKQKDVKGLSSAIKTIMELSDKERALMGKRGRVIVEEDFNIQKESQKLAELISA